MTAEGVGDLQIRVLDEVAVYELHDDGRLFEVRQEQSSRNLTGDSVAIRDETKPSLTLGTRVYLNSVGDLCLVPPSEPAFDRRPGVTQIRRRQRQVKITGDQAVVWALLERLDGTATASAVLEGLSARHRSIASALLCHLATLGVVDLSGRPVAKFIHRATMRGVLPDGQLNIVEMRRLLIDRRYRSYPGTVRLPLVASLPDELAPLHALTRARRSPSTFEGRPVTKKDLEAVLGTACGPTGTLDLDPGQIELRAYPSPGALYAVEIYPVALAVSDLEPALYHYLPLEHELEELRPALTLDSFLDLALPDQREALFGVAVIIVLTGVFRPLEKKYGEGAYRVLVAEAGHISQNLILAATALGLGARPVGGFFDEMLNRLLSLDPEQEQFLLAVLLGYSADAFPA